MKRRFRLKHGLVGGILLGGTVLFSVGYLTKSTDQEIPQETYFEVVRWMELYSAIFREIVTGYVDFVSPEKLARKSIDAMLEMLDPYTEFITREDMEEFQMQSTGKYGGIGALVQRRDSFVMIRDPYRGYPAFEAGLRPGDLILQINDQNVVGWKVEDVTELLRGTPRTTVEVTVFRPATRETLTVQITRREITIEPIQYAGWLFRDSTIIYIKLRGFQQGAGRKLRKKLAELIAHRKPRGIILDLRGNPGGLLDEAILVANAFLPQGTEIVSTRMRGGRALKSYRAPLSPIDTVTPLVVLVDGASASASEIVAGAIQDLDRGVIIGERTFGKGLVQSTRRLPYSSLIKLTVARYYTPSGRSIQALIYTHADTGKGVVRVPDSLRKPYRTRNGRTVYAGNGIDPDIRVQGRLQEPLLRALLRSYILFDFATRFYFAHLSLEETFQQPAYEVDDATFQAFLDTLRVRIQDVQIRSDRNLERLKSSLEKDSLQGLDETDALLDSLRNRLASAKYQTIMQYREGLQWLLEQEISHRFAGFQGQWTAFLEEDPVLDTALQVLRDSLRYVQILSPPPAESKKESKKQE